MSPEFRSAPIDGVVLDWDGTIADARERVLAAFRTASGLVIGRDYPVDPDDEILVLTTPEEIAFQALTNDPDDLRALVAAHRRAYLDLPIAARALPGAVRLLEGLASSGVTVGVVTAKARAAFEHDARALGVRHHIEALVAGDDGLPHKPDPAPVLACIEALGVAPDRAVMVGDARSDIAAGRAAGLRTCATLAGFDPAGVADAGADLHVATVADLLPLIVRSRDAART